MSGSCGTGGVDVEAERDVARGLRVAARLLRGDPGGDAIGREFDQLDAPASSRRRWITGATSAMTSSTDALAIGWRRST